LCLTFFCMSVWQNRYPFFFIASDVLSHLLLSVFNVVLNHIKTLVLLVAVVSSHMMTLVFGWCSSLLPSVSHVSRVVLLCYCGSDRTANPETNSLAIDFQVDHHLTACVVYAVIRVVNSSSYSKRSWWTQQFSMFAVSFRICHLFVAERIYSKFFFVTDNMSISLMSVV